MKNKLKIIPLRYFLVAAIAILLLNNCASDSSLGDVQIPSSTNKFGEVISIPGVSVTAGDFVSEMKTSNEGIYIRVYRNTSSNYWIYRLNGFVLPNWIKHEEPDHYFDWGLSKEKSEGPNDFAIYFRTTNKNGFVNINTGLPALLEQNNPSFSVTQMLIDNSPSANKWAFSGSTVKIKQNNDTGQYNTICTLPSGIVFAEADPYDAVVWAAAGTTLYKISVDGDVNSFDIGSYDDSSFPYSTSIEKIRFSYDVLHKDVYFRFQNKVFRIKDGNTLSLFYTINNESNSLGGDFCLDNAFMYATDGTKKHLQSFKETNIIPPMPNTKDQQIILDYLKNVTSFKVGPIEVLKNSTDGYIYSTTTERKILRVPKSL